jgi:predicted dehydrogenase
MKKKISASVIGLGVGERHLNFLKKNKNIDSISVYDVKNDKAKKISKKYNSEYSSEFKKIFSDKKINLLIVASPDHTHHKYILEGFKSKKNVFTEKPICNNLKELKEIIIEWKKNKNNLKFRSNLILRSSPLFLWLKRKIEEGYFGKIYSIDVEYLYGRLEKFIKGWRGNSKEYSPMNGGGIHMIDLACWMMNELPNEVISSSNNLATKKFKLKSIDYVTSILNFKSGLILRATANLACVYKHQHIFKIFGTKKTFVYDDFGPRIYNSRNPKKKPKKINLTSLPSNKTNILKNFVDDIINKKNISKKTEFDLKIMNVLCYCNISYKTKKKQSIKYYI